MIEPGRKFVQGVKKYRYGFNGKEKLEEIYGGGNAYDYGERIYDPRLGRLLSIDPLIDKYPELSSYQYANNSPIANIDLLGQQDYYYMLEFDSKTGLSQLKFNEKRDVGLWGIGNIFPSDAILEYPMSINGKSYMAEYYLTKGSTKPNQATLDVYNGKSSDEIATLMVSTPTKWGAFAESLKKDADDTEQRINEGFIIGAAIQRSNLIKQQIAANTKVSTEGKKESTNNSGTQNAGGKNNTTNPQKAGAVTGTPTAGENAKPVVKNRNTNDAVGDNILYDVHAEPGKKGQLIKIGKGKGDDVNAAGDPKRMKVSERKARAAGYPNATGTIRKRLGTTTTKQATDAEAIEVKNERANGNSLPLNKERGKKYKG